MAQYDVHRVAGNRLVVDCQANLLSHLESRLVVEIVAKTDGLPVIRHLNPVVRVADEDFVMLAQAPVTIRARDLKEVVGSVAEQALDITRAFDVLLTGI